MPFTTSGTFERLHNWEEDRLNGIEIVTDHHDAEDDNFADGLSQTLLKDGRAPMEGALNMGGFSITGLAGGVNKQDAVTKAQLDEIELNYVPLTKDAEIGGTKKFLNPVFMPTADLSNATDQGATTQFVNEKINTEFALRHLSYIEKAFPTYSHVSSISSGYITSTIGYILFELPTRMSGYIQVGDYQKSFSYSYNNTQPMLIVMPVGIDVKILFSGCSAKFVGIY